MKGKLISTVSQNLEHLAKCRFKILGSRYTSGEWKRKEKEEEKKKKKERIIKMKKITGKPPTILSEAALEKLFLSICIEFQKFLMFYFTDQPLFSYIFSSKYFLLQCRLPFSLGWSFSLLLTSLTQYDLFIFVLSPVLTVSYSCKIEVVWRFPPMFFLLEFCSFSSCV